MKENAQQEGHIVIKCPGCADCAGSESQEGCRRESETSGEGTASEIELAILRRHTTNLTRSEDNNDGGRKKVARFFNWASAAIATQAHKQIEKGGFKRDQSTYPETPGEEHKNPHLPKQRVIYRGSSTPDARSIAPSVISSRGSFDNGEGPSSRARSQVRSRHESLPVSLPPRARSHHGRDHSGSLPGGGLLDSSPSHCPPNPGTPSRGWGRQLSPFSASSPGRSRANSASDVSPTTTSPAHQSLSTSPPTIVISPDING